MAKQPQGCLRRFLVTVLSIVLVISALSIIVYQRMGGSAGVKRRLANMALKSTEKRMIEYRPDGVSEQQIQDVVNAVREANDLPDGVDLVELYRAMKEYDQAFHSSRPSNDEMVTYLLRLQQTIQQPPE